MCRIACVKLNLPWKIKVFTWKGLTHIKHLVCNQFWLFISFFPSLPAGLTSEERWNEIFKGYAEDVWLGQEWAVQISFQYRRDVVGELLFSFPLIQAPGDSCHTPKSYIIFCYGKVATGWLFPSLLYSDPYFGTISFKKLLWMLWTHLSLWWFIIYYKNLIWMVHSENPHVRAPYRFVL